MTYQKILLALGLLVLLAIAGWFFIGHEDEEVYGRESAHISDVEVINKTLQEKPLFVNEVRNEVSAKAKYRLNITYPKVVLATSPSTANQASDVVKAVVNDVVDGFLSEHNDVPKDTGIPDEFESDLTIRYSTPFITTQIMVVRLEISSYLRGAAHPSSQTKIVMYDLVEHEVLAVSDIFASGIDYLDFLSQTSRGKLRTALSDMNKEEFANSVILGTEARKENFQSVYPTADGIHVVFDPYQVAPYARGTIEIDLSNDELAGKISERISHAIENSKKDSSVASSTTQTLSP